MPMRKTRTALSVWHIREGGVPLDFPTPQTYYSGERLPSVSTKNLPVPVAIPSTSTVWCVSHSFEMWCNTLRCFSQTMKCPAHWTLNNNLLGFGTVTYRVGRLAAGTFAS